MRPHESDAALRVGLVMRYPCFSFILALYIPCANQDPKSIARERGFDSQSVDPYSRKFVCLGSFADQVKFLGVRDSRKCIAFKVEKRMSLHSLYEFFH